MGERQRLIDGSLRAACVIMSGGLRGEGGRERGGGGGGGGGVRAGGRSRAHGG